MKQILVQPEQIGAPKKLSQIIREFTFPQIRGQCTDGQGRYCVYGGLLHYFGAEPTLSPSHASTLEAYLEIQKGLHDKVNLLDLIGRNNNGSTFAEIADFLELYDL